MTTDEINARNLVTPFPCEVHVYRDIDDTVRECIECKMLVMTSNPQQGE